MDTKTTQQKEFDTALAGLTPQQKATYMQANPNIGVGGVQQMSTPMGSYTPITMSLKDLNSNVQPYNLPQTQPVIGNNLGAVNSSVASNIKTDANYVPPTTSVQQKSDLIKSLETKLSNTATEVSSIQQDSELLKKKEKATAVSNELDQLDKSFRDEVAQIKTNPEGKLAGALQNEIAQAQDRYENRRANIALTYKVLAGDYNAAQEIANQKVQALKEKDNQAIELYKANVAAINDDLTEKEKLQVQANITAQKAKSDEINNAYEQTLKALQGSGQEVPSYIYDNVDRARTNPNATPADIYKAAANYAIPLQKIADTEQLYQGLSGPTATAVRAKVSKFSTEPIIQNFATIQEGRNFAQSIDTNTKNPADDQALIYSLAKALDPGSVVREGEYATAQKYAQSWIKAYGKGVTQAIAGTGFLSKEARENIKKTIDGKYQSSLKSYENLQKSYTDGINNLTGRTDAEKFLVDYAISAPSSTSQTGAKTIDVGGKSYIVGQVYNDGTANWIVDANGKWSKQ